MPKKYAYALDKRGEKYYYSNMENAIEINRRLAKNLTYYRKTAGFTQAELAEKINYSDKSISKWESGNGVPDIYTLLQLAKLYGVTVDTLLGEGEPIRVKKKMKSLHTLIMLLCSGIVWLVATAIFVPLLMLFPSREWWLIFLYAVPVNAIVLLVYAGIWKYKTLNFISVSIIIWSVLTCLYLTIKFAASNGGTETLGPLWSLFLLGIPLQVLEILWVYFRFVFTKNKKLLVVEPPKGEEDEA